MESRCSKTTSAILGANAARAELERRGMDRHELSTLTGLSEDSLTHILRGRGSSRRGQRLIEAALKHPCWSTAGEFAARLPMIEFFGVDIEALHAPELQALWRRVTGKRRVACVRKRLLPLLREHFAAASAAASAENAMPGKRP